MFESLNSTFEGSAITATSVEMSFAEHATRARFEVAFETERLSFGIERNVRF